MTSLAKKQEAFDRAYAELGNTGQAYAPAGYSEKNSLITQQEETQKLLNHPHVSRWIGKC